MTTLARSIHGIPIPKGNLRGFVVKGRAILTDAKSQDLKMWAASIRAAFHGQKTLMEGPVEIVLLFSLLKSKSRSKKEMWPTIKPDIDKIIRAVFDAMSGVVFRDDRQIVALRAVKRWALDGRPPGVEISVQEIQEGGNHGSLE